MKPFKLTKLFLGQIVLPLVVGAILVDITNSTNCILTYLPVFLPCWVWNVLIYGLVFVIVFDVIVYYVLPRFLPEKISIFLGILKKNRKPVPRVEDRKSTRDNLVSQIKSDLIQFRETLRPMKNSNSEEQKNNLTLARNILNGMLNDKLPESEKHLVEHKELREKLENLDVMYQDYCTTFTTMGQGVFRDVDLKRNLWGTKPKDQNALENQIFMLIDNIIDFMNEITSETRFGTFPPWRG